MAFSNRRDVGSGGVSAATVITLIQQNVIIDEELTGTLDDVNTVFTTTNDVNGGALDVFLNGPLMFPTTDYVFSGTNTITFTVAPPSAGLQPRATYVKA